MNSAKQSLSPVVAGALAAALCVLSPPSALAAGEAMPPAARSIDDFCANVAEDFEPYDDDNGNRFEPHIECLAFSEITRGQSGGRTYGPTRVVHRDRMASLVARLIDIADELDTGENIRGLPAFDGTVDFADIPSGNAHRQNIDRLSEAGIVSGGPQGRPMDQYGPELEVTRAQMASLIANALNYMTGEDLTSSRDFFVDDEMSVPHEPRINAVAQRGIAVGDGRDTFTPRAPVARDQMAGFLVRTLAALEADGSIALDNGQRVDGTVE
jgi:hypothetical protein